MDTRTVILNLTRTKRLLTDLSNSNFVPAERTDQVRYAAEAAVMNQLTRVMWQDQIDALTFAIDTLEAL